MKNKFPLGWILAVAALLVMAGLGFMSSYYATGGKLAGGIIVAVCMLVIPIVLTMLLIKLKGTMKPFFFRRNAFIELGVLILMLAACFVSMWLIDQFFAVNSQAEEIGGIMKNLRGKEEEMFDHYDNYTKNRKEKYMGNLGQVVTESKGNEIIAAYVINELCLDTTNADTLKADIEDKGTSFYNTIKRFTNDTIPEVENVSASDILKKSKWWELPMLLNQADSVTAPILDEYNQLLARSENGKADIILLDKMVELHVIETAVVESEKEMLRWSYVPVDAVNIKHFFTDKNGFITSIWSVLIALAAFVLALLPYLAADNRDPRSRGLLEIFKKSAIYI